MENGAAKELELRLIQSRRGDAAALGTLLERYRNYLTLLARLQVGRRLQGKVSESDLVQQTILEAYRDFLQFRGNTEAELVAWLRSVFTSNLANQVRHFYGTRGRNPNLERELSAELERSSHQFETAFVARQPSPSEHAIEREHAVLLADAIEALPADYRDVIIARHFEGLSFAEVARRLGRSEDSAQKLWVRALAHLRKNLPAPD